MNVLVANMSKQMSKPIITKQMLIDADACAEQVDLFEETFGDSVVVTVKRAEKVAASFFHWDLAIRLLDAQGRAEYERAAAAAWAECERVGASALPEYGRAMATAWATAFIDMHKRGESA
jgi:hypothetical protein